MKNFLVVTAALVVGCGGADAPPPKAPEPTSTPAPTADCQSTLVSKTPAGWVPAGKLVVKLEGEAPKHLDATDISGKNTLSSDVDDTKVGRDTMLKGICSAGGLVAVAPDGKPAGPLVTLPLFKPANADPALDVAAMCKTPELPADIDPTQRLFVAVAMYNESLVSTRWRGWLNGMSHELATADDDKTRVALKAKHGDELDSAAKSANISKCWFVDALHGHS